jgi:hypothetical protein
MNHWETWRVYESSREGGEVRGLEMRRGGCGGVQRGNGAGSEKWIDRRQSIFSRGSSGRRRHIGYRKGERGMFGVAGGYRRLKC